MYYGHKNCWRQFKHRWIQKRPAQGHGGITLLSGWDCKSNFWGQSKPIPLNKWGDVVYI